MARASIALVLLLLMAIQAGLGYAIQYTGSLDKGVFELTQVSVVLDEASRVVDVGWAGSRIVLLTGSTLAVVDPGSGVLWSARPDSGRYTSLSASSGLVAVASASPEKSTSTVYLYSVDGSLLWSLEISGLVRSIGLGPNGGVAIVGDRSGAPFVALAEDGALVWVKEYEGVNGVAGRAGWSPDGSMIMVSLSVSGGALSFIDVYSTLGDLVSRITGAVGWSWGPGGVAIAGRGPALQQGVGWLALVSHDLGTVFWNKSRVAIATSVYYNPSGCCIATDMGAIVDAATGTIVASIKKPGPAGLMDPWMFSSWSPGGGYLLAHTPPAGGGIRLYSASGSLVVDLSGFVDRGMFLFNPGWSPGGDIVYLQTSDYRTYYLMILAWPRTALVTVDARGAGAFLAGGVNACTPQGCVEVPLNDLVEIHVDPETTWIKLAPRGLADSPQTPWGPGFWVGDPETWLSANIPSVSLSLEPTGYTHINVTRVYDSLLAKARLTIPQGVTVPRVKISWDTGALELAQGRDYNDTITIAGPPVEYRVEVEYVGILGPAPPIVVSTLKMGPGQVLDTPLEPPAALLNATGSMILTLRNDSGEWRLTVDGSAIAWLWSGTYTLDIRLLDEARRELNLAAPQDHVFTLTIRSEPGKTINIIDKEIVDRATADLVVVNEEDRAYVVHVYTEGESLLATVVPPRGNTTIRMPIGLEYTVSYYDRLNPEIGVKEVTVKPENPEQIIVLTIRQQETPDIQTITATDRDNTIQPASDDNTAQSQNTAQATTDNTPQDTAGTGKPMQAALAALLILAILLVIAKRRT